MKKSSIVYRNCPMAAMPIRHKGKKGYGLQAFGFKRIMWFKWDDPINVCNVKEIPNTLIIQSPTCPVILEEVPLPNP